MKKRAIIILLLSLTLLVSWISPVAAWNEIYMKKVIDSVTIPASGSTTSDAIVLNKRANLGYFSIQVQMTGDGTAKFEYLLSDNGTDFMEPTGASDIATDITKTSGPGSDGKDMFSFNPMVCRSLKIRATETGGANSVTVTVWIVVQ